MNDFIRRIFGSVLFAIVSRLTQFDSLFRRLTASKHLQSIRIIRRADPFAPTAQRQRWLPKKLIERRIRLLRAKLLTTICILIIIRRTVLFREPQLLTLCCQLRAELEFPINIMPQPTRALRWQQSSRPSRDYEEVRRSLVRESPGIELTNFRTIRSHYPAASPGKTLETSRRRRSLISFVIDLFCSLSCLGKAAPRATELHLRRRPPDRAHQSTVSGPYLGPQTMQSTFIAFYMP